MNDDRLARILESLRPKFEGPGYVVARGLKAHVKFLRIKYLHLTPFENTESIWSQGLKSENGRIFFVDAALVLADVALNQVFADHIQVFGLKAPKRYRLRPDIVEETTASRQWYYKGEHIPPEHLVDLGTFRAVPPYDQFVPYPEKVLKKMPEEERRRNERGLWPTGVMAYLENP